jgi:cytochrome c biogenesis protein CcdA
MDLAALALALVAGAVAAFNPCGFALLPAYLTMLVATPETGGGQAAALVRAARFTTGMTGGFVAVFGAFALVVAPLALSVERWLPVLTVVIGLVLLGLGAWLLSGHALAAPRLRRAGRAPGRTWGSQVGYGTTFALASLSCTLAPFLAVTTSALRGGSLLGVAATFVAYALGMGTVVGVLAVAAATASTTVTTRLRRAVPMVSRLSGGLLVLAGAYVAWYGWFELRVLAGTTVSDPVVSAAINAQSAMVRWVAGLGVGTVLLAASGVVAVVVGGVVMRVRRRHHRDPLPVLEESRG